MHVREYVKVEKKIVVENNKRVTRKGGVNAGDAIVSC